MLTLNLGADYDQTAFARMCKHTTLDENGCWVWQRAKDAQGYGRVGYGYTTWAAHRLMYSLMLGEIPEGLVLDHLCRVPACCNPAHLDAVTQGENLRRGVRPNLTHCPKGHEYSDENTYRTPGGNRRCRTCATALNNTWERYSRKLKRPELSSRKPV